jgi:hypothetical protein
MTPNEWKNFGKKLASWKCQGMKFEGFDIELFTKNYYNTNNCELCYEELKKKNLDHDHLSGVPRFIVCSTCNFELSKIDICRKKVNNEILSLN